MDSPSPRIQSARSDDNDESELASASLWSWANSMKPLHKFLSVLIVSLVLAALGFSSLPLWRPIGALVLQRLWDVLRFLVLTTSIGLGILNSRLWRGTHTEADSAALGSGKDDSKVPFVGMLYGEVQHSYSFSDKEAEPSESGSMRRSESERDAGLGRDATTLTDGVQVSRVVDGGLDGSAATLAEGDDGDGASLSGNNDHHPCTQHATRLVNDPTSAFSIGRGIVHEYDGIQANVTHHDKEGGTVAEEASANPLIHMHRNAVTVVVSSGKGRLVKPYDDIGLAAVDQQPKQSSSKIIHRRGRSSEFPTAQEWGASTLESHTATSHQGARAQEKLPASAENTASSIAPNAAVHVKKKRTESSGSIRAARRMEHTTIDAGISGTMSKHSRSQSAYNFNELLVQQPLRSKAGTSSQLSKRRNVSLSCDLDKEYTNGRIPALLVSLPSPPEPPLIYGYENAESGVVSGEVAKSKQDESSLRKAFSESLAPWRAASSTVPMSIPTITHTEDAPSNKDPSTKKSRNSTMKNQTVSSPTTMGSPSPGELNKKVDAFIARFHEQIRLQRLESLERSKKRGL